MGELRDEYIEIIELIHNINEELASIQDKRYLVMYIGYNTRLQKFEQIKNINETINKNIGIIIHNDSVKEVKPEDVFYF